MLHAVIQGEVTMSYDIIGDVHGFAEPLEKLLAKMGYAEINGSYTHPQGKKVCFLGDLVDRGPDQKRVIEIVRNMMDADNAVCIMGNHEFNAICYAMQTIDGAYIRPHSEKNFKQHEAFLKDYPLGSKAHAEIIDWFKTLPVFLERDGFAAIHACWDEPHLQMLKPALNQQNCLTDNAFIQYSDKTSDVYQAIEYLMKGPELELPKGVSYTAEDGSERTAARIKWWADKNENISERLFVRTKDLDPHTKAAIDGLSITDAFNAHAQDKPVFVGHYWMSGAPALLSNKLACLDYSAIHSGIQVGYRYQGERSLKLENFI
tara:strand:+ start:247203 stop:248156 length:954 start_codon:yes stop_codon:yes gene_type:complete